MSAGLRLLSAIVRHKSKAALWETTQDMLTTDDERKAHDFIKDYVTEFSLFPSTKVVKSETGVLLERTKEPYKFYQRKCLERAMYDAFKQPYSDLYESLQQGQIDMQAAMDAVNEMHAASRRFSQTSGIETHDIVMDRLLEDFEYASTHHDIRGITCGWDEVDKETLGYQPSDLIVWVGRPARGKSWLLLNQAYAAWKAGYKILFISMEMSSDACMRRMVGIHAGINPTLIRSGQVSTLAKPRLMSYWEDMRDRNPIDMCTANFDRSVDQIVAFIERYLPDIVYIDAGYLLTPQKKRYGSSGRRETISDVIEELKSGAANVKRPIVTTVQFNREAERRRRGAHRTLQNEDQGQEQRIITNPIAHLGMDVIGETDVISQAASHIFGADFAPPPFGREARVFGFLKGREGEDGYWYCNYPATTSAVPDFSIIPFDDERIVSVARGIGQRRRQSPTDLSFMR